MKCVKNLKDGRITRVTNETGTILIKHKTHEYCSKKDWKIAGRP